MGDLIICIFICIIWFLYAYALLLADSTMALTQAFILWKNVWFKNFGSFPVSSVCPILKEKFRGSGCLKFSIMCLDSLRQCTRHGYPAERPPVAPCSRRVKLKVPQQTSPLLSYQSLAAFLGSSKYFLSTEEKYPLANKILPCLERKTRTQALIS